MAEAAATAKTAPAEEKKWKPPAPKKDAQGIIISRGAFDDKIGDLIPGQLGWLPLDDEGLPSGAATVEPPAYGTPACAVMAAQNPPPVGHDLLVTAAGAPLIPPLNSNVDKRVQYADEAVRAAEVKKVADAKAANREKRQTV